MSRFRCSSGHLVPLTFGDGELRLPCPNCGVEIYKFRDALLDDNMHTSTDAVDQTASEKAHLPPMLKPASVVIGVACVAAVILCVWHRSPSPQTATSRDAVIPIEVAARSAPADPALISITNFRAMPTDGGVVTISFRLTNAGPRRGDYPGLAVHWHGAAQADQRIGKDAYAHPPLPFTTADVTLELGLPPGATGVDVAIIN